MMPRTLLTLVSLLVLLLAKYPAVATGTTQGPAAGDDLPVKILLIVGGCCHDYDNQQDILKEGLEARANCEVTIVHQGGTSTEAKIELYADENWADDFDVIIHDECFANVDDEDWVDRILAPHRAGKPAVVLHCAMHCYRTGKEDWFEFCGVTSHRHGSHYPHEVLNFDPEHEIMSEFGPAWMNPAGELYWIERVWPSATPLATAKNRENGSSEVCVWTNDYHGTRVFGTTLGHHNETVQAAQYLDMVTRGTLWAADALDAWKPSDSGRRQQPVNLARSASVETSSDEVANNNLGRHAVDGNPATRWCAADGSFPQQLLLDLGELKSFSKLEIDWESDSAIYRYKVEVSPDRQSWATLVDREQNDSADSSFEFQETEARYLQLTCFGSNTGNWSSLYEISLFGSQLEWIDPAAEATAQEARYLDQVSSPQGFGLSLFASPPAVQYPVFVAAGAPGELYVAVDRNGSLDREANRGAVYRLKDIDGDGRADQVRLFVPNVDSPRGLVWDQDRLYVMHPPHLSAYIDRDHDGVAEEVERLVSDIAFSFADRPADHTSNGVTLGIDGWLYLAIGDFGFLEAQGSDGRKLQLRGGGVVRVRPDGTGLELYSRGTRNILEVGVDPLLNGFARDNTNDRGGWDVRLHHFSGFDEHGYPSKYINFAGEALQPLADYGGGSGCGGLFLQDARLPSPFRRGFMSADWGRNFVYFHPLTKSASSFAAEQLEFMSVPRVTDLDIDEAGSLYVSSWNGATFKFNGEDVGYVVQLSPQADSDSTNGKSHESGEGHAIETLEARLRSSSHVTRLNTQRQLLCNELKAETTRNAAIEMLQRIVRDSNASLDSRVAALFALKQGLGPLSYEFVESVADESALRPFVIRALGDRAGVGAPWDSEQERAERLADATPPPIGPILMGLGDDDPRTRLEAAIAMARLGLTDMAFELERLLDDPDGRVRHTAIESLRVQNQADVCFGVLDRLDAEALRRQSALRVLQQLHTPQVAQGLVLRLGAESNSSHRLDLFGALCRLYQREGEWRGNSWGTRPDTRGPYYQPETWDGSPQILAALQQVVANLSLAEADEYLEFIRLNRVDERQLLDTLVAHSSNDPNWLEKSIQLLSLSRHASAYREQFVQLLDQPSVDRSTSLIALESMSRILPRRDFELEIATAATLLEQWDGPELRSRLLRSTFRPNTLKEQVEPLTAMLDSEDSNIQLLAYAGLGRLLNAPGLQESTRQAVIRTFFTALETADRQLPALRGIEFAESRFFDKEIAMLASSEDAATRRAANSLVRRWGLAVEETPVGNPIGEMSVNEALEASLALEGNADNGVRMFARLNCANCHTVSADEPLRGPYLPQVAKTYETIQLMESILEPNKSIAQGFATETFLVDDGRVLVGFVTFESSEKIVIRDQDGTAYEIEPEWIESRRKEKLSSMPAGIANEFSPQDLADLVAYLKSLAD